MSATFTEADYELLPLAVIPDFVRVEWELNGSELPVPPGFILKTLWSAVSHI